jgi:hypothetical protein
LFLSSVQRVREALAAGKAREASGQAAALERTTALEDDPTYK